MDTLSMHKHPAGRLCKTAALLLFLTLSVTASTAAAADSALKKASLIPLWSPQAQFAGYYVALDKGIYAKHGLELTIITGGPDRSPAEFLQSGKADFAVLWLSSALQQRSLGVKLVNVAQLIQRSSVMLVAKKGSGIETPADMNGKKVGLWGGDLAIPARAFFAEHGLKVREVPQTYTVNLFLRGGTDVASAMWFNEYHTILDSGLDPGELSVFFLHAHGITFPEDGLYALEKTVRKDPARADAFIRASIAGWHYAFAHQDEALDIVIRHMREAKVPANRMHQKWMLERMRDLILPAETPGTPGLLKESDYEAVGRALMKFGLLRKVPDYAAFTRSFHDGK